MSNNLHPILSVKSAKINSFMSVSIKTWEAFGQLMELNVAAAKTSLEERQSVMQAMMSVKNSQELWTMQ